MAEFAGPVKITVLGSGTSVGVPTVGCDCKVCRSEDPRDKRLRPSILVSYAGRNVLIDTTPDLRYQALRSGIARLDAVIFTHAHADHIMGLDDVRPFNFRQRESIPIFGNSETVDALKRVFSYIFEDKIHESSVPRLQVNVLNGDCFDLFGLQFVPVPIKHGKGTVYGYRFGDAAYLTDHSAIPDESMEKLHGLDVLFLDALRYKPHPTHTTVDRALQYVEELEPKRAYFTHISHDLLHAQVEERLPPHVRLAHDCLEITVETASTDAA